MSLRYDSLADLVWVVKIYSSIEVVGVGSLVVGSTCVSFT